MTEPAALPPIPRRRRWLSVAAAAAGAGGAGGVGLGVPVLRRRPAAEAGHRRGRPPRPALALRTTFWPSAPPSPTRRTGLVAMASKTKMPARWPAWDMPPAGVERRPRTAWRRRCAPETKPGAHPGGIARDASRDGSRRRRRPGGAQARRHAARPFPDHLLEKLHFNADAEHPGRPRRPRTCWDTTRCSAPSRATSTAPSFPVAPSSITPAPSATSRCLSRSWCAWRSAPSPSGNAERTIGQGEPSSDGLATLQRAMEEEAEEPLLLSALRGERGGMDQFMQSLQDGSTSVKQMQGLINGGPGRTAAGPARRSCCICRGRRPTTAPLCSSG